MHQIKKGNQWCFGMKAHVDVDAELGLVHSVIGAAASVNGVTLAQALLHGGETKAFGDVGHQGTAKRPEAKGSWHVSMRPGKRRVLKIDREIDCLRDQLETIKALIRVKVGHLLRIIRNNFGLNTVRYRGLAKNTAQLMMQIALADLMIAKRRLFELNAQGAPEMAAERKIAGRTATGIKIRLFRR